MNPVTSDELTFGYFRSAEYGKFNLDLGVRLDRIDRNGSITEGHHDEDEHHDEESIMTKMSIMMKKRVKQHFLIRASIILVLLQILAENLMITLM